jgi:hypothetical protein
LEALDRIYLTHDRSTCRLLRTRCGEFPD